MKGTAERIGETLTITGDRPSQASIEREKKKAKRKKGKKKWDIKEGENMTVCMDSK